MKYLGSSLVSYNQSASVTGGSSEVVCDISLVDCAAEGDMFSPPPIGTPSVFAPSGAAPFYGIIDRYSTSSSASAYPSYSVHLSTGLFLLQGVKLITSDYYGVTSVVPNLVNIFGYLENTIGFGGSEVNDAGISWAKIATAVTAILNNASGTDYGGPIKHKSFKYGVDLSNLPAIPAYYRINTGSMSLLEFIQDICEAGGHDFIIRLQEGSGGLDGVFKVFVISRLNEPTPGAVESFIDSSVCVSQSEVGQELRKDSTSKFVVGANVERMWYVRPSTSGSISGGITATEYTGYNVLPYFGNDAAGNYIVGRTYEEEPNEYYFDIDIRDVGNKLLGPSYTTCFNELRAARKGRDAWERFLAERSCNKYMIMNAAQCGATSSLLARPFIAVQPTGAATKNYDVVASGSEYSNILTGHNSVYMPKFGASYSYSKYFNKASNGGVNNPNTPSGFFPDNYYTYNINFPNSSVRKMTLPDYFTTNTCSVNNTIGLDGSRTSNALYNLYYPSTDVLNPYFLRSYLIGAVDAWAYSIVRFFESDLYEWTTSAATATDRQFFSGMYDTFKSKIGNDDYATAMMNTYNSSVANRSKYVLDEKQKKATHLYNKIKDLADNYYGKKYMVSIPSTYGAIEPESNKVRLTQSTTDTGYIDQSQWASGVVNGLIPDISGINTLTDQNEKFYPYIKYENAIVYDSANNPLLVPYNYTEISTADRYIGNPVAFTGAAVMPSPPTGAKVLDLWVKCSISDTILFKDNSTLFGPRAVLDLPGSITYAGPDYGSVQALYLAITNQGKGPAGAFRNDANVNNAAIQKMLNKQGLDQNTLSSSPEAVVPNMFAVPLRSNILCYGPWYLAGANGPIEYEKNDDLAPWNYGGFTNLDTAGFSRVTDGVTNQTFDETGSVTVAGLPSVPIGDALITGGPYVTDINVTAGSDGFNTTYSFQSWSSQGRLSKLTNFSSERIKRLSQVSKDLRRSYREGVGNGLWRNPVDFLGSVGRRAVNVEDVARRDKGTTSHSVIAASVEKFDTTVVFQPTYNAGSQQEDNYVNKTFMSIDGLLRPYSNWTHSKMSSLVMPVNTGAKNTSLDLHPLKRGHDINIVTSVTESGRMPTDGAAGLNSDVGINSTGVANYYGMAFKGPIMVQGWGRDIKGVPVPLYVDSSGRAVLSGTGSPLGSGQKQWAPDYLYNSKSWKTGPIDLQWDEDRGVWTIPSSGGSSSGGGTSINCNCGCECADGYDLVLPDGTKTTKVMRWVPPTDLEIDVPNGHIWLPQANEKDDLPVAGANYYPLHYTSGSTPQWELNLSGYLEARYSDYISSVDGSTVRGPAATTGVTKSGYITFSKTDLASPDLMSIVVEINGTIAATG